MYIELNKTNWYINSLGKNEMFYYGTITNDTETLEFQIETTEKLTLDQVYIKILELPEYNGGLLVK